MFETAYAMGAPQNGGGPGNPLLTFAPFILMFVIIYLLLIRPQQKKQKEHQRMLSQLSKGDRVVTSSGMFGTIVGIDEKENKVVLRIADNTKVEFLKSSIAAQVDKGT